MSETLPPGIYKIRHNGVNFATNPPVNGLSISFRGEIPAGDAAKTQQWQVSAHGVIASMATKTTFVWSITSSTPCAHVIRNSDKYEWIVRADKDPSDGKTFVGTIMTNDCEANYWGVNGTNIELQSAPENFRFIPVLT